MVWHSLEYGDGFMWSKVPETRMQKGSQPNQLHATQRSLFQQKHKYAWCNKCVGTRELLKMKKNSEIYKRGRNSKSQWPKCVTWNLPYASIAISWWGTRLIEINKARLEELIDWCLQQVEVNSNRQWNEYAPVEEIRNGNRSDWAFRALRGDQCLYSGTRGERAVDGCLGFGAVVGLCQTA